MFVPLTPLRCLERAVDLYANKIGIVCQDRQFTYREFADRCRRLASALHSMGLAPGDRVAYISFNNAELMEGYFGVVQAHGIVMPLNVRLSPGELTAILNHAEARFVFYETEFEALIETLRPQCGKVEHWITIDDSYERLLEQGTPQPPDILAYDELSIAELFYTSGSTGTPKGVTLSHRTLYLHCLDIMTLFEEPATMVDLHTIPLFHANGWGRPQCSTLLGVKQVMVRRFEPVSVLRLVAEHRATHMCLVPTMANALLNAPELHHTDVSSLRQIMLGGAAASPDLVERVENAFHCQCVCGYGLTETSPVITHSRNKGVATTGDKDRWRRQAMAGWALPGVQIRVVGPDLRDVARDMQSIGEVIAYGDHVMDGYFREPEQTAAVMDEGWFHTGDMAMWDEEGYVHIVDRKKEIIVSGGENISSIEVEKAIFAHPAVFECAVVAAPDEKWGEVPAAFVVLKEDAAVTESELLEFLSSRLGRFKLPRVIQFQREPLPKTGTGKIRKMILKEQFWAGKAKRVQGG